MKPAREVLLVDDNPADLELTAEFLSRSRCSSRIHSVNDGDQAIEFLQGKGKFSAARRPDLIVLDLNLPRKPGRGVLAEIKRDPCLREIPVIIFSTSQAPNDVYASYQLGANSYVRKPGNLADFVATVTTMGDFWFCCADPPHTPCLRQPHFPSELNKENS